MIWLLIDVGTSGLKAATVSDSGVIQASAYQGYSVQTSDEGVAEQQAEDWWQAAQDCMQALDLTEVEAIAITGQMQDLILLDASGQALRPVILYSDTRATEQAERINTVMGKERLIEITGNAQTAASVLAKLLWLQEHEAEILEKADTLLVGAADYLVFKLTGQSVSDSSTASTTGLMSLATRSWCQARYFEELGIHSAARLLATLLPGGSQVGQLTPRGQEMTGINRAIPIFIGPGDAVATTLGMGSGSPDKPYAYLGTSGWIAFSSTERGDPEQGVFNLAHPQADRLVCIAPLLTAGATIDWIKKVTSADDYSMMINKALSKAPSKLIFLPYLQGERSPFYDPLARGSFIGLAQHHDQDDMVRAVLEGLVFAYKEAIEVLVGKTALALGLTGGGSQSPALCQLFADVTGMTITVPSKASFSGLLGTLSACQQGQLSLAYDDLAYRAQPELAAHYSQKYRWFKEAYQLLKPLFTQQGQQRHGSG